MPESESTLTRDEAEQIAAMRETLKAIERRLTDEAYGGSGGALNLGRLIEAVDSAEEALFNVLNVAHAYLYCRVATEALKSKSTVSA